MVGNIDVRGLLAGVGLGAVALTPHVWLFLTQPSVGFVLLLGTGFVGAGMLWLFAQYREPTGHRGWLRSSSDEGDFIELEQGGVLGAWVERADIEDVEKRRRVMIVVMTFTVVVAVGSFLLIFLAHPLAEAVGSAV